MSTEWYFIYFLALECSQPMNKGPILDPTFFCFVVLHVFPLCLSYFMGFVVFGAKSMETTVFKKMKNFLMMLEMEFIQFRSHTYMSLPNKHSSSRTCGESLVPLSINQLAVVSVWECSSLSFSIFARVYRFGMVLRQLQCACMSNERSPLDTDQFCSGHSRG